VNTDLFIRRDAWLHRLDPRTKFALTLAFIAIVLILNGPALMLAALAILHLLPLSS